MIPDTQEWGGQQFVLAKIFQHGEGSESKRQKKREMFELKTELESQDGAITHYIYHTESSTYALYKKNIIPAP